MCATYGRQGEREGDGQDQPSCSAMLVVWLPPRAALLLALRSSGPLARTPAPPPALLLLHRALLLHHACLP